MIARALLVTAVLTVAGCGPVQYVSQVTRRASREVAAAKSAGADKYAIYHYTLAVEYLRKAREEAGYADYQAAIRFGKKAETHAIRARKIAEERAGTEPIEPGEAPIDPSSSGARPSDEGRP